MQKWLRYAKGALAVAGAVVTALGSAQVTGADSKTVVYTAVTAGLTALGVILVPNAQKPQN